MLTPAQFTQAHLVALKEQMGDLEIKAPRDLEVQVVLKDNRFNFSLERAYYQEYALGRKTEDELIAIFITGTAESVHTTPGASRNPARFVPLIKRRDWLEAQEAEILHDAFSPDLVVVYAEDRPNTVHYLTAEDVENAGVAREDLRSLAIDNLLELLTIEEHSMKEEDFEDAIYMLSAGGDYEASLILVDEIIEQYQEKVTGQLVIAIPIAGAILLTGSGDEVALWGLEQAVSRLAEENDRLLTTQMFVYKGNGTFSVIRFQEE